MIFRTWADFLKKIILIGIIVGSILFASLVIMIPPQIVRADANCDKAETSTNPAGNEKGNEKKCNGLELDDRSKEPIRKCNTPNANKDNGGPEGATCKVRGNN